MPYMFKPGQIEQIKELRSKTGMGLREAHDLFVKHGSVEAALESIGGLKGAASYVSPEQKTRDLINDFYKALDGGKIDELSARSHLSFEIERAMGMSFNMWKEKQ